MVCYLIYYLIMYLIAYRIPQVPIVGITSLQRQTMQTMQTMQTPQPLISALILAFKAWRSSVAMTEPSTRIHKGRQKRPRVPDELRKRAVKA